VHDDGDIRTYWYISWGWVLAGIFSIGLAVGAVVF